LRGGLDNLKLTKPPLIYTEVLHISVWGGLELCFRG